MYARAGRPLLLLPFFRLSFSMSSRHSIRRYVKQLPRGNEIKDGRGKRKKGFSGSMEGQKVGADVTDRFGGPTARVWKCQRRGYGGRKRPKINLADFLIYYITKGTTLF